MKNKQNLHSRHASVESQGFTLLELSVVIVVIGLVVGGVVSAKSLIESFKFRKLMAQIEQFKTATVTFENKYDALPGDMKNATSLFTADPSCSGLGVRAALTAPNGMTCNGNGDGMANYAGVNYGSEWHLFWQHLSLAGLLAEQYTGTCAYTGSPCTSNYYSFSGRNAPLSALGDSVFVLESPDINYAGWGWFWTTNANHVFWLGGLGTTDAAGQKITNGVPVSPTLTPIQAYALDLKYDDGVANKGKIISGKYASGSFACDLNTASYSATNASYKNLVVCSLMFDAGF